MMLGPFPRRPRPSSSSLLSSDELDASLDESESLAEVDASGTGAGMGASSSDEESSEELPDSDELSSFLRLCLLRFGLVAAGGAMLIRTRRGGRGGQGDRCSPRFFLDLELTFEQQWNLYYLVFFCSNSSDSPLVRKNCQMGTPPMTVATTCVERTLIDVATDGEVRWTHVLEPDQRARGVESTHERNEEEERLERVDAPDGTKEQGLDSHADRRRARGDAEVTKQRCRVLDGPGGVVDDRCGGRHEEEEFEDTEFAVWSVWRLTRALERDSRST
jgi:hypothetical protein